MSKPHIDLCLVCERLEWAGRELVEHGFIPPLSFTLAHNDGPIQCVQEPEGPTVAVPVEIHYVDAENNEAHATVDTQGMELRIGAEVVRT